MSPSPKSRLLFLVTCLACVSLPGCKGGAELDPASSARLDAVPDDANVLASVTCGSEPVIPPLDGGRVLGRAGNTVLVDAPRTAYRALDGVDDLERLVVWGRGTAASRMDPLLRTQLLELVDEGGGARTIPVIATFREDSADIEGRLKSAGAMPRTVTGRVVTMDAGFDALMTVLTFEDLLTLTQPRELRMLNRGN